MNCAVATNCTEKIRKPKNVKIPTRKPREKIVVDPNEPLPEIKWPSFADKTEKQIEKLVQLRTLRMDLPRTAAQRRKSLQYEWKPFVFPTDLREWNGLTICLFIPTFLLPTFLMNELEISTANLVSTWQPKTKSKSARFEDLVYHIGNWARCRKRPGLTGHTKHPAALQWIESNRALWSFLSNQFKLYNEPMWTRYRQVIKDNNLVNFFDVWATCAVNINFASEPHVDGLDRLGGLCWVVAFGDFTHGELVFPYMKLFFPMGSGHVIAFNSCEIVHYVRNYGGNRNSIVLFTHDEMFSKV